MASTPSCGQKPAMKVILAIDIGSSSVRCSAYEVINEENPSESKLERTSIRAVENVRASRTVSSVKPNTGKIQLLLEEGRGTKSSLMDNVDDCIDEILVSLRRQPRVQEFQVVAVAFSTFVMNLVGVDEAGKVVGDDASISYACNSPQVAKQCRALRSRLGDEILQRMYQKTGTPIHSAYALPQLLDIYDETNPVYDGVRSKIHKWQSIASICLSRWMGTMFLPISFSEASWTGLFNFRACDYEPSVVDLLPDSCRRCLPTLADFSSQVDDHYGIHRHRKDDGTTHNPYWDRWPELRGEGGCRLFLGLGDGACANIGSKCSTAQRIAVTVGTSAAARVCLPLPMGGDDNDSVLRVPRGLFCYRIDRGHVLLGGALTDGGSIVEWIATLLNLTAPGALEDCMKKVETLLQNGYSSSEAEMRQPLTVAPFLGGERSTGYRDGATGAILGLTRETTPAHLLKACLEGVTLRLNAVLRLMRTTMDERLVVPLETSPCIVASGKALEVSSLWRQMLSDCSGMDVIMDGETEEGTSRGAAIVVASALAAAPGMVIATGSLSATLFEEPLCVQHEAKPNPSSREHWHRASHSQETFIDTICPLFEGTNG